MQRLLIADDQVPDSNLSSENEIRDHYARLYRDQGFAEGFVFLRKLINLLRARGYNVDCANTPDKVIDLVKTETYNVVVLDLGWYAIDNMPKDDKMILGWELADEIQRNSSARILMFSNRFYEDQELARTAAEKGYLPVYKSYDDACARNLLVTIRWAALQKSHTETLSEEQKIYSFRMYRRLSNVLLASIISSLVLLLITVILVVTNKTETTIASSIFGVIATFVSGVIYKYVDAYKKNIP
jgi:hypothetical protein